MLIKTYFNRQYNKLNVYYYQNIRTNSENLISQKANNLIYHHHWVFDEFRINRQKLRRVKQNRNKEHFSLNKKQSSTQAFNKVISELNSYKVIFQKIIKIFQFRIEEMKNLKKSTRLNYISIFIALVLIGKINSTIMSNGGNWTTTQYANNIGGYVNELNGIQTIQIQDITNNSNNQNLGINDNIVQNGYLIRVNDVTNNSSTNIIVKNINCAKFDTQGNCLQCSQGAYFSNGVCTLADANCKTFNNANGQCTSCYGGFVLIQGKCVAQNSQNVDPNCAKFDTQGNCLQCSQGAYFSNGVCTLVDANCKTFNNANGQCTSCYGGFVLIQGKCVAQNSQNVDPNCAKFDTQGNCLQCSQGAYFSNGVCTLVDANCKTFNNANGQCTSCYGGFVLIQGKCVAQNSQNVDPNCAKFDTQGNCLQCSQGAYFSNGVCTLADANCKTFNNANGQCTSCYGGFVLIQGKCYTQSSQNVDPNCAKFDTQGNCLQCSQGAYFSNGVCTLVDANCKTFNNANGQCTSCYGGFVLIQGKCVAQNSQNVDPNCAKFDTQGNCLQCSQGAYFSNGVCTLADANCKTFNNANGQCTSCYGGFVLIQGKCYTQSSQNVDPNCAKFDTQGNCLQCSQGAYFSNGVCTLVDANCKTFNNANGQCTSCYGGFVLIQGKCVAQNSQNVDPNCAKFDTQGNCLQCSQGAYFSNGVCTLVDANCKTFNNANGQCTSCYGGFVLIQGKCYTQSSQNVDPNCAKFDTQGNCLQCSQGAYFSNGVCTLVDANCKTFNNANGQCTSCYGGFVLIQGKCVAQNSQNVDPNCAKFDTQGNCLQCSQGAYFSNGVCTLADANCKTFNNANGQCTSCYGGFVLIQGKCYTQSSQNVDPNCAKFDTQGNCLQCSQGAYFSNGVCTLVDANCKTFNNANGQCTSCYGGFVLIQGKCVAQNSQNVDPNCAKFDTQGNCLQCSQGAYFSNGVCTLVDANCKTFNNANGQCTSCYGGFVLIQGKCYTQSSQNVDPNCAKFDTQGNCLQCSQGAYFSNGVCTLVDVNCKTFNNANGQCTSCYGGFVLIQGKCVAQNSQNVDPNCAKFDTQGNCLQCSQGAYFSNGVCTLVDANCKTFNNANGQCTSCYGGFVLIQGKCVAQNSQNVDPNCAKFDTQGNCLQCSQGAYFSNGVCTLADANCKTFNNANGQCTSCYGGFVLIQGKCVAQNSQNVDPNCAKFDTQGNCLQCSQGAYFSNGVCTLVDANCKTFNNANGQCTSCYGGFVLIQGKCVAQNSQNVDPNCAKFDTQGNCLQCNQPTFLYNGICKFLTTNCNIFNNTTGQCLSCKYGFLLVQTSCVDINTLNLDPQCLQYDSGLNCLSCCTGYYLSFVSTSKTCQKIDPNCQVFNHNTLRCDKCVSSYVINSINLQCVTLITSSNSNTQTNTTTLISSGQSNFSNGNSQYQTYISVSNPNQGSTSFSSSSSEFYIDTSFSYDPYCQIYSNSLCVTCFPCYSYNQSKRLCQKTC